MTLDDERKIVVFLHCLMQLIVMTISML